MYEGMEIEICKIIKGEYVPVDNYKLPINYMNW